MKLIQHPPDHLLKAQSVRSKSNRNSDSSAISDVIGEGLLPYGLPRADLLEPKIKSFLKPIDLLESLHLAEASADGFLASITKSFNILSILILFLTSFQFEFATRLNESETIYAVFGHWRLAENERRRRRK